MVRTTRGTKRSAQFPRDHVQRKQVRAMFATDAVAFDQMKAGIRAGR